MFVKLRVLPADQAPECPFYAARTVVGGHVCFVKQLAPVHVAMALVEENPDFLPQMWDQDCGGNPENCSVAALLYRYDTDQSKAGGGQQVPGPEEDFSFGILSGDIHNFDPYGDNEEEGEPESTEPSTDVTCTITSVVAPVAPAPEVVRPNIAEVKQEPPVPAAKSRVIKAEPTPLDTDVQVSIHQIRDPYTARVDAIVYPANNTLVIDDALLLQHGTERLQKECERYQLGSIRMGHVYPTSNGGDHANGVRARRIYHAVVGGASRLVDPACIQRAVKNALRIAEMEKIATVAMLPCDCGTWDIEEVAQTQLLAIYNFLRTTKTTCLKNVVILIEDDETLEAFNRYFDKVWGA